MITEIGDILTCRHDVLVHPVNCLFPTERLGKVFFQVFPHAKTYEFEKKPFQSEVGATSSAAEIRKNRRKFESGIGKETVMICKPPGTAELVGNGGDKRFIFNLWLLPPSKTCDYSIAKYFLLQCLQEMTKVLIRLYPRRRLYSVAPDSVVPDLVGPDSLGSNSPKLSVFSDCLTVAFPSMKLWEWAPPIISDFVRGTFMCNPPFASTFRESQKIKFYWLFRRKQDEPSATLLPTSFQVTQKVIQSATAPSLSRVEKERKEARKKSRNESREEMNEETKQQSKEEETKNKNKTKKRKVEEEECKRKCKCPETGEPCTDGVSSSSFFDDLFLTCLANNFRKWRPTSESTFLSFPCKMEIQLPEDWSYERELELQEWLRRRNFVQHVELIQNIDGVETRRQM